MRGGIYIIAMHKVACDAPMHDRRQYLLLSEGVIPADNGALLAEEAGELG